ncbi:MAG TPA: segregation/condensation protein A, partial [Bacillales bacterium]|nr:segregation/condensation protein A [Bacillales bacterium]
VNRLEIDIYEISVLQITDQYMEFIHAMQELQLDVAGEYLLMAATLLEMKSKMLLPTEEEEYIEDDYEEFEGDPREELIRRLVEYRKYKIVSEQLKQREAKWQLVFAKPAVPLGEPEVKPLSEDTSVYDMISALQKLARRKQLEVPKTTKIERQEISIKDRMNEVMAVLDQAYGKKTFYDFYDGADREQTVTTFLAVLELMKKGMVSCRQEGNFADIMIYKTEGGGGAA